MARRKLSSILKELDEVAHQVDQLTADFTGEGLFDRVKREWKNLRQQEPAADDPYKVLGLDPNCIPSDIVAKYRSLAKKYHPDNMETGDEGMFKKATAAYEIICKERNISGREK